MHITKRFWPYRGGVERYVEDLALAQVSQGHRPLVITEDRDLVTRTGGLLPRTESYRGLDIERIPVIGGARKQFATGRFRTIAKLFREADVVHHHDPRFLFESALALRRVTGTPLIFHTHGLIFHTPQFRRLKRLAQTAYYGPALRRFVDLTIADSQGDAATLRATGGPDWPRLRVVPNAVDLSRQLALPDASEPQLVLNFGRIDDHKGLEAMLDALALVRAPWRLVVVGEGPGALVAQLHRYADDLRLASRVTWAGQMSDAGLLDLLSRASVVLFPSEYEGFGLALLEALAAARVVVANDIPTHREILGPALTDRLVRFGTESAPRGIEAALGLGPERRKVISAASRERATSFDMTRLAESLLGLYAELGILH